MQQASQAVAPKFKPPLIRPTWVRRDRLIDRLDRVQSKVVLIAAPSGFGKTSLLASWVAGRTDAVTWLSLGTESYTLSQFLRQVFSAAEWLASDFDDNLRAQLAMPRNVEDGHPSDDALTGAVLDAIGRSTVPWTLVIDDYHVIDDSQIHAFVTALIASMPDDCRLVISTRHTPPLPVARLSISEDLLVLKSEDLSVTPAECRAMLGNLGVEVGEQQALDVVEHTGGWIVAVHLIASAAQKQPLDSVIKALETFRGELELLSDFLFDEVLGQQTPEVRDFLLKISILDHFTVETCHAVSSSPAAALLLDQIWRDRLFLIELDESRTWFRFHELFREFLRRVLTLETDPEVIQHLHSVAKDWYLEHNLLDDALAHGIEARDWTGAAEIIRPMATSIFATHRLAELLEWLRRIPRDAVLCDPDLSSIAAYALVRQSMIDASLMYLEAAEIGYQQTGNSYGLAITEIVRGAIARFHEDGPALIEHAIQGLTFALGPENVPDDVDDVTVISGLLHYTGTWIEALPHGIPYFQLSLGLLLQGRVPAAERIAERFVDVYRQAGDKPGTTNALTLLARARVQSARLVEAEALARPIAQVDFNDVPIDRAMAVVTLAEVLYAWDQLDDCEQILQGGLAMLAHAQAGPQDAPIQLLLARVYWAREDFESARAALATAVKSASRLGNQRRVREAKAFQARIAMSESDLDPARRWSSTSGLSFEVAGDATLVNECLVQARLLIASGDAERAVEWLVRMRDTAEQDGRPHDLIQILVLLSIAYLDAFDLDHAIDALRDALNIGEPQGYLRVFLDESLPMLRLLRIAHRRGVQVPFVEELLELGGEIPGKVVRLIHADLVEPITAREIEVLKLVALGLTNKEISDELYLALATVKRHITNINGKFGVSSRTAAVQKARRLGLLSNDALSPAAAAPRLQSDKRSNTS